MNWGSFKQTLTDAVVDHLEPIQASYIHPAALQQSGFCHTFLFEFAVCYL
jgi:hypothetical protein